MFKNRYDIPLKTSIDIFHIRKSCRIVEKTLIYLKQFIVPGITTGELDRKAEQFILEQKARPALKGFDGFPAVICTSVNTVAAHGIPSSQVLCSGDILTIDLSVELDGWYGDAAWTYLVGEGDTSTRHLLKAAWQASLAGVLAVKAGGRLGNPGYFISKTAKRLGCCVLEGFGGHGIGRQLHEDPVIPHFGKKNTGMRIVPGMVFTIEPILSLGKIQTNIGHDGWAIQTVDDCITAQFEHTVAVFKDKVEILTFSEKINQKTIDYPPYF